MIKPCTICGGWGSVQNYEEHIYPRHHCNACNGTGKTDAAEYESEICANCEGNGCWRCKWTGEVWRKVESETSEGDE